MFEENEVNNLGMNENNLIVYGNGKMMEVAGVCTLDGYAVTDKL